MNNPFNKYNSENSMVHNITDSELYPNGLLPDGMIECKSCGKECVDASADGKEMCTDCLQEKEEAKVEMQSGRGEDAILCDLFKAKAERLKLQLTHV